MNTKLIALILSFSFLSFTTVYAADPSDPTNSTQMTQQNAVDKKQSKDGEIIATLIVINEHEIAAANEATKRNINPTVKKYAEMLKEDHEKNLQDTQELSKKIAVLPVETETVIVMKEQGQEGLNKLKALNDQQFEVAYIQAMIKGHQEALDKLKAGIRNAKNPELKAHLRKTSGTVANHLQMAKAINDKLKSNS